MNNIMVAGLRSCFVVLVVTVSTRLSNEGNSVLKAELIEFSYPIVIWVAKHLEEGGRRVNQRISTSVRTSFQDTDFDIRILRQSRCDSETRRATANDDEVIVLIQKSFQVANSGRTVAIDAVGAVDAIGVCSIGLGSHVQLYGHMIRLFRGENSSWSEI